MSTPRIKLYKSLDDGSYAAVFVGNNGKHLPMVIWDAGTAEEIARSKAETWWNLEAKRLRGEKPSKQQTAKCADPVPAFPWSA